MNLSWLNSARLQKLALALLAAIAVAQGVVAIGRDNDFAVHRELGKGFLQGDPYAGGLDTYPVPRMMFNGLLASVPHLYARAGCYLLALLALYAVFRMWSSLAEGQVHGSPDVNRTAGILVALGFLPYLLRDLDECGLQIFLLFFLTAAAYALVKQRALQTGFWIATGIAYKVAPLLFVPFLMWKRQWRATAYVAVFSVLWALVPALYLGMDATMAGHKRWFARISKVNSTREAYPSLQEMEPPKPQNLSLMATLARYLETYPNDHRLFSENPWLPHHPGFRQFGNLDQETAFFAVRGILLGLGLILAWRWRRAWTQNLAGDLPSEWACVTMLATLLAPQCWKQHLVVVLPAAFLALRQQLLTASWFRWRLGVMGLIVAVVLLSRQSVVGRDLSVVLLSYKLDSIAALLLLALNLTMPSSGAKFLSKVLPLPLGRARAA